MPAKAPCLQLCSATNNQHLQSLIQQFIHGVQATTALEWTAVLMGIVSVYFSRRTSIWVYPTGLINTVIYVYLSFRYHLLGEAAVNFYYTVMSIWGWWLWARKDAARKPVLQVTYSSKKEWVQQVAFAMVCFLVIYAALTWAKKSFAEGAIPWADGLASATAFTGMWLMARKKVESWWWWIATNICSVPLYFVKGLVVTSVYYFILLVMAVAGLLAWQQKVKKGMS